jgi:hypothetical protein
MMRRIRWIGPVAIMLLIPTTALAAGPSAHAAAEKQCRTEQQQMGSASFKAAYGTNANKSNAFGKCVSHRTSQDTSDQSSAQTSAESQCSTQQSSDPSAFKTKYGTNANKSNAFGMCVSQTARTMSGKDETTQVSAEDNAAKQCRSEQSQDAAAFKTKYGTNANKSNAFGKCVSEKARSTESTS